MYGNSALLEVTVQVPGGQAIPPDMDNYPAYLAEAPVGTIEDPLGYWNRDCGGYVSYKLTSNGQTLPPRSEIGLPGFWPGQPVIQPWIVTDPRPGDIAVVPDTTCLPGGHCLYVSWVQPNGHLVTKSCNTSSSGCFEITVWAQSGVLNQSCAFNLVFIRFPAA